MSIEQVTSGNLRRTQAFDKELRSLSNLDAIADEMADAILSERNGTKRKTKIGTLVDRLVKETETKVFPQAEKIGRQNAIDILSKTPDPIDLNDPQQRASALFQGRQRYTTRLNMVRDAVSSNGNTLDSALTRYWLEPSEGDAKGKVERLRQIHNQLEKKRKAWETDMRRFTDGEIKTRPTEPRLDFLSEMTAQSKKDIRVQARRAGTDAEIAMFSAKGYAKFVWVTPNGASACPDCRNRQSVILTVAEWERIGRPGSGRTVCGAHCFCMLVPAEAVSKSSALLTGKHTRDAGPLTSPDDLAILNANRVTTVKQAERKAAQVSNATPTASDADAARKAAEAAAKQKAEQEQLEKRLLKQDPFHPGSANTTIHTPVSDAFKADFQKGWASVPESVRDRLNANGLKLHVGEFVTDIRPDLKGKRPRGWAPGTTWDMNDCLAWDNNSAVSERSRDYAGNVRDSKRVEGAIRHEMGHNVDAIWQPGTGLLSKSPGFQAAYQDDLAKLSKAQVSKFSYYATLGDTGASEAFAEGFANLYGGGCERGADGAEFGKLFPKTVEHIRGIVEPVAPIPPTTPTP